MKKVVLITFYSVYLFFLLGFILHTSAHPEILGKYTSKYFLSLIFLIILFSVSIFFINFMFITSIIKVNKKKYKFSPRKKILVGFFILIGFFLISESFLQKKYDGKDPLKYIYSINNFHPFLQFQPTKDINNLNINNDNFRGDEISINKDENTFRIFVVGGSTVLNSGISYNEVFSKKLQNKLRNDYPNKKIEVLNAGVDGYTSEHSLIQYLFKIKDYDPDLIIIWQGVNDWYYSCKSPLAYGEYKNDYSNFYGAAGDMVHDRFFKDSPVEFNFLLMRLLDEKISNNLYSDLTNKLKEKDKYKGVYANENLYEFYDLDELPSLVAYERNMSSLVKILAQDQVPLILGNQASLYKENMTRDEKNVLFFGSYHCAQNGKYPTIASTKDGLNKFNDISRRIAEANQATFVDLDALIPKNLNYFTDDAHYTSLANVLIAEILYKKIIEGGFIN